MITRKELYDTYRSIYGSLFRHNRNSANILSRVSRQLDKYPLPYKLDNKWPYHLIIYCNNWRLSVYAEGMDRVIEICPLKLDGSPYSNRYEKSFLTPKGAVNYILKRYGG